MCHLYSQLRGWLQAQGGHDAQWGLLTEYRTAVWWCCGWKVLIEPHLRDQQDGSVGGWHLPSTWGPELALQDLHSRRREPTPISRPLTGATARAPTQNVHKPINENFTPKNVTPQNRIVFSYYVIWSRFEYQNSRWDKICDVHEVLCMAHPVLAWCYNELQLSPWRPKQQASLPFQALWKCPCPKDGVHFNHRPCSERSETWTLP